MKNIVILTIALLLLAGCSTKEFTPDIDIDISTKSVQLHSESLSNEFVTITITRKDSNETPIEILALFPENVESLYVTDATGNQLDSLEFRLSQGKGSKDTKQFKIWGTSNQARKAIYDVPIEFIYQNNIIYSRTLEATVTR